MTKQRADVLADAAGRSISTMSLDFTIVNQLGGLLMTPHLNYLVAQQHIGHLSRLAECARLIHAGRQNTAV